MKRCSKCQLYLTLDRFANDSSAKDGKQTYCKDCRRVYSKTYREKHCECRSTLNKTWHVNNNELVKTRRSKWRSHNSERIQAYRRKHKYGLSEVQYNELVDKQDGRCAICNSQPARPLFVDHCHKTGKVRGLLCHGCNILLGTAVDDIERLHAAINYLRKFQNDRRLQEL